MKEIIDQLKKSIAGVWEGEGFAKFPTIQATAYTEHMEFKPDEFKDAIFYSQKTLYKNDTEKNDQTVFWDTGFIILVEREIVLHSVQIGGRMEQYFLSSHEGDRYVFDSVARLADPKTIRSQRVLTINEDGIHYELNMALRMATEFQNHLEANLKRKL